MRTSTRNARRSSLCLAIALALTVPAGKASASSLVGDSATVMPGDVAQTWFLSRRSSLFVMPGGATLDIDVLASSVDLQSASVVARTLGLRVANDSQATIANSSITGQTNIGLALSNDSLSEADGLASHVNVSGSTISGGRNGVSVDYGGQFGATATSVSSTNTSGTGVIGAGLLVESGSARFSGASAINGATAGIIMGTAAETGGERQVILDDTAVHGQTGSGLVVLAVTPGPVPGPALPADVQLRNGSTLSSGNGMAIDVAAHGDANIVVDASRVDGDARVADGGHVVLGASHSATFNGAMQGDIALSLASAAQWHVTALSSIASLDLSGGVVAFDATGEAHQAVTVRGPLSGSGGDVTLNVVMNSGGSLVRQATDRLLIQGDVTTTGTTILHIVPTGEGALTDIDRNGISGADEGISVVQVGGASRADAFATAGNYVAAGPWSYTLHAFGPGQADQGQSALATGPLTWDYRLGNHYVCEGDCTPVEPEDPGDPGSPGDPGTPGDPENPQPPITPPPDERPAVVPQLPSYLSAPVALLNYGDVLADGLRQRLGDIRQASAGAPLGAELFVRGVGGQFHYAPNQSFTAFGYGFSQQVNALQAGGSLLALDDDTGVLRAGWALDHGTTRVTPAAADGNSVAKYLASGVSAWVTWQHVSGAWVDAVLGSTRYRGDVGTDLRGSDVARLRATGTRLSVEAGMPFAIAEGWSLEPGVMLATQSLRIRDFQDDDGLDIRPGVARQTTWRAGALLSRTAQASFMPYARLDLSRATRGNTSVTVASEAWDMGSAFDTGKTGSSIRTALGAISQIGRHVQLYGEGTWQHAIGGYGLRGWSANLGLRITF